MEFTVGVHCVGFTMWVHCGVHYEGFTVGVLWCGVLCVSLLGFTVWGSLCGVHCGVHYEGFTVGVHCVVYCAVVYCVVCGQHVLS